MSARAISVQLVGGFRVEVDGAPVPDGEWRRRSAASLVKLLALAPGRRMHRERVLAALWPDVDPADAAPRLHKAAHYARRCLGGGPDALVLAGDTVSLGPDAAVEVDAVRFEERARAALAARDPAPAARLADAHAGELLPDDLYEPWAEEPRDRLRLLHLDLLRLAGRWAAGAALDPADEQAHVELARALADLSRRHPALLDGLDDTMRREIERALSGRDGGWDGRGGHQRPFIAAAELLRLAAAGAGAVLLVDDAHEADEASLRLLHFLSRATIGDRVAVVLGHRPVLGGALAEIRNAVLGRGHAAPLDLRPLRPVDAVALAHRHAPAAPVAALQALAAAAGGLPFAVVEGARAVAADPAAPPGPALLPPGLSAEVLRAVAPAAVLGASFDTDEFVELTGLDDDAAYAVLDAARGARLLRRTAQGFAFGHALQREALLERWTGRGGRRAAHLAAARALQRLGRSPGRIGFHLVQAGAAAEAVPWVLRAAETEAALGAYRDALTTLDQVRTAATGADAGRLLALRADLLSACGQLSAVDAYREALAAVSAPEPRAQGLLAHHRGEWFQRLRAELRTGVGRPELAVGLFDSHLCVAEYLLYGPTPYDEVLELGAELRRTAERAGVLHAVAFAGALRGEAALLKGDLDLAEAELAEAADLHHALEAPGGEAHSLQRLAEVHLYRGDRELVAPLLQRAIPLARWSIIAQCLLPRIYGTMIDAAADLEAAIAVVDRAEATLGPNSEDQCSFCVIMLAAPAARACAAVGDLGAARRWLAAAEASVARWEGTAWEGALLEVRAAVAGAEGQPIEAARMYASAAALFDSSGQPFDAARCRSVLEPAPAVQPAGG